MGINSNLRAVTDRTSKERCAEQAGPAVRRQMFKTVWTLLIYYHSSGNWLLFFPLQKTHNGTLRFNLTSLENGNLSPCEKKNSKEGDEKQERNEFGSLQSALAQLGNGDPSKLRNNIMTFNECLGKRYSPSIKDKGQNPSWLCWH